MPNDELDAFLAEVAEKVDADYRTQEAAAENAEKARQDFLQEFRDIADRAIKPEFERAQRATGAMTIKARHSPDSVELSVTMKKSQSDMVSGLLRYRADLNSRRIFREGRVDRLPQRRDTFPVYPPDLTAEQVQKEIVSLVRDAQFALENKRP
jgi:hypothetical protein